MIANEMFLREYCKDFEHIENYDIAKQTGLTMYVCHHRNEHIELKTSRQLKDENRYYDIPASELIFLPENVHKELHERLNKVLNIKRKLYDNISLDDMIKRRCYLAIKMEKLKIELWKDHLNTAQMK